MADHIGTLFKGVFEESILVLQLCFSGLSLSLVYLAPHGGDDDDVL
jgi:hypothetical protein